MSVLSDYRGRRGGGGRRGWRGEEGETVGRYYSRPGAMTSSGSVEAFEKVGHLAVVLCSLV